MSNAYTSLLRVCAKNKDLYTGTKLHDDILKRGLLQESSDALVTMYAKCGALAKAQELLQHHKSRNVVPWTALISGYVHSWRCHDAVNCFEHMQCEHVSPNAVTFTCILNAYGSIKEIIKGKEIHAEVARNGMLEDDVVLGNALVDMYANCGALAKAQEVLEELPVRDIVSWNTLISAYAEEGQGEKALKCFEWMKYDGFSPNAVTYLCLLKACGSIGAADKGEQIHAEIARQGLLRNNVMLGSAVVDMYAKCGALDKARSVLDNLPSLNVAAWNALTAGYAQENQSEKALECFEQMRQKGFCPSAVSFACVLKVYGSIRALNKGIQIHDEILKLGLLGGDSVLEIALVDMYVKCGALGKAQQVLEEFPVGNIASWNALIAGYAQQGQYEQVFNSFAQMQREGLSPDAITYLSILKACSGIGAIEMGKRIHDEVCAKAILRNCVEIGNALVDMYVKCGALAKAHKVLEDLRVRDVVSWNALIAGYASKGECDQAVHCVVRMQHEGLCPDEGTFVSVLKACGSIGAADMGEQIHGEVARHGLLRNSVVLGTALVDMYAKCGSLTKAQRVLEEMPSRNVITWSALIAGFAEDGHLDQALDCLKHMRYEGILPNATTLTCLLEACGRTGAVDKGELLDWEIGREESCGNRLVLGTALLDMYAKCGAPTKAQKLLEKLSVQDGVSWSALLGACQRWGNSNVGRWAFEHALQVG